MYRSRRLRRVDARFALRDHDNGLVLPRELISWTELSRPTVRGRTACGNSTVSRTGRIGKRPILLGLRLLLLFLAGSFAFVVRSERDFSAMILLECVWLKFLMTSTSGKMQARHLAALQDVGF